MNRCTTYMIVHYIVKCIRDILTGSASNDLGPYYIMEPYVGMA